MTLAFGLSCPKPQVFQRGGNKDKFIVRFMELAGKGRRGIGKDMLDLEEIPWEHSSN